MQVSIVAEQLNVSTFAANSSSTTSYISCVLPSADRVWKLINASFNLYAILTAASCNILPAFNSSSEFKPI
jgi:hypothetical protein